MNNEITKEYAALESEKRLQQQALKGYQYQMSEQLNGCVGRDMIDVLSGKNVLNCQRNINLKTFGDGYYGFSIRNKEFA